MANPLETLSRDVSAYLRGPVGDNTFRLATSEGVRNGIAYQGLLLSFPQPQDNGVDDFGIQKTSGFTVEIADERDDADWMLLAEDGGFFLLEDLSGRIILENT